MEVVKERDGKNYVIKVVSPEEQNQVLFSSDIEMDARARQAVKVAIEKPKFCKKSVAWYDTETKRACIEYVDGTRKYVGWEWFFTGNMIIFKDGLGEVVNPKGVISLNLFASYLI